MHQWQVETITNSHGLDVGSEPLDKEVLRGGEDKELADQLTKSAVVTGSLAASTDTFQPRDGLDGPDQYYTFTLKEKTAVETAVGVNSSDWSPTKGHRSPWQPGLFLLTSDGRKIREGQVPGVQGSPTYSPCNWKQVRITW